MKVLFECGVRPWYALLYSCELPGMIAKCDLKTVAVEVRKRRLIDINQSRIPIIFKDYLSCHTCG